MTFLFCVFCLEIIKKYSQHGEVDLLRDAVRNSLFAAHDLKQTSISMPAISSGIFGFDKELCARVLFDESERFVRAHGDTSLVEIRFTNFDQV